MQLQQQCCSCRSSTTSNQFRIANYIYVPSLVTTNESLLISFNLLPFHVLYHKDLLQLQLQHNYCSCSSGTFLSLFRISNYSMVQNLVKKFHKNYNIKGGQFEISHSKTKSLIKRIKRVNPWYSKINNIQNMKKNKNWK